MSDSGASPSDPILKACACLVDARGRLLVFRHPGDGNTQLPKGTIEPGESPEAAVRRELLEESGIDFTGALQPLGTLDRECEAGVEGNTHRHPQLWHLFLMRAEAPLPETFEHMATGSPEEEGLVFSFRWLDADDALDDFALPYRQTIERVRAALLPVA
ncbi:8-oxo-dGTP pyrophosphatase MutT (NUDIX family) [Variovorax boronicumulans]|uniref:8-oxo-dGTP pyrophosphatase MutT (NUDIX family) n=1 Tax=Variovorax boronicumulans TaxID=436515 RepID=A0AAW8CTE3_9BURK|nr:MULTISPECIES: NUDIX domain-containing protein [Variovorax]MDP9891855.1 8-oxo-dGTP pyrophosphatase MutT (NUDIX family) [Variovorax boronicumulans]MDQ0053028.1 8-oxo-dGTP pyrophosphatase MutT (NUDIX family) [Variovorax boronicumulans]MDQ0607240.1 8-oxo-dGTP pyrophosphatase MutT (NUDIX family) [Variovorax sp. W1I1]